MRISGIKDLSTLGFTNIFSMGILGIFWIYLAQILDANEYGKIGFLICCFASIGSPNTLIVYGAKKIKIQNSIYTLALIGSFISSIVIFLIFDEIAISVFVIGYVIFSLITSDLLGKKLYQKYSKFLITQRVLMVCFALLLFHIMGINGIILGYGLSFLPFSKLLYQGFKQSKFDLSLIISKKKFILNNYGFDLAKILNGHLDKLIIVPLLGFALLGNYHLGYQVIIILALLPTIVFQYALPRESSGISNVKIQKFTIFISIIVVIFTIIFAPVILPVLFPKFIHAIEIIQIMSLATIFVSISLMYTSKFLARENSGIVFIGSGIRLSVQTLLVITLGWIYGINGVAVSFVIASASESIWFILITRKNKLYNI